MSSGRKLAICLIEDNIIISGRMAEVIENKYPGRFEIKEFTTPDEALTYLKVNTVDV